MGATADFLRRSTPAPAPALPAASIPLAGLLAGALLAGCGAPDASGGPPPGAALWLRPDSGVVLEAGRVVRWRDASGHGHDARAVTFPPGVPARGDPPDRRPAFDPRSGAVDFDGVDDLLGIRDSEELNLGGPYATRTVTVAFRTGADVRRRQMIFETGGDLRGFNVYLDDGHLYLGAFNVWNDDGGRTTPFGPTHVRAPVEPRRRYVATLVLDAGAGRVTGFVNGDRVGSATGVGRVFRHHEEIGIGGILEDTHYHDGVRQGVPAADFFAGAVEELLVYNRALGEGERRRVERWLVSAGEGRRAAASPRGRDRPARKGRAAPGAGGRLYVTSGATDQVLVLDADDGRLLTPLPLDRRPGETDEPHGIAVAPGGGHWYVTLAHGEPTLWKFELPGDRLVGRVPLGIPGSGQIGLTPDGRRAFIPDYLRATPDPGRVALVELATLRVLAAPPVCPGPHEAAVDPAGGSVAVACTLSDEVAILDVATAAVTGRFPVGAVAGEAGAPRYRPINLTWAPDGSRLFVSLHEAEAVRAFTPGGSVLGTARVGGGPAQVAITPDGRWLAVANRHDRSLSLVDAEAMREVRRVDLGADHPHAVKLDPEGVVAWVACEGSTETPGRVVAVELVTGRVLWSTPAGAFLLDLAFAAAAG